MEKIRKVEALEAVLVVPKRALLVQSIVNLKLLRKVADDLGLKISIVTQDKLGKMLVEKAGISVGQKVEDTYEEDESLADQKSKPKRELKKEIETVGLEGEEVRTKRRLEKIGSVDYFVSGNEADTFSEREKDWQELEKIKEEKPLSLNDFAQSRGEKEGVIRKKSAPTMDVTHPRNKRNVSDGINRSTAKIATPAISEASDVFSEIPSTRQKTNYPKNNLPEWPMTEKDNAKDQQLENFFYANNFSNKNKAGYADKKEDLVENSGNKFFKGLVVLGAILLFLGLSYVAYNYVPKAQIVVFAKKEVKSADATITGNVNYETIDYEKLVIPAKLLEFDEEVAETFSATGSKNVSNKKAKGKITIYNEFSTSSQPLVATTRFLSEDQKIFRLVQGVTIPGTTKVGAETKPGVAEAEVIADEAGDSFNISATSFTIPGFKNSGNDKYAKIYAKSTEAMSGGGNSDETVRVVTEKDISGAKDKISLEITDAVKQKIKDSAVSGTIILDDSISIDEPVYRLSNSQGEMADSFEIKVSAHARALVFTESDIKKIANSVISKSGNGKINIDSGAVIIDYGKSVLDTKLGTIEIKMHASNVAQPNLDLEKLKRGILGKNNDELAEYLKTYPSIEKAEVEYFPQLFISKIPMNEKRVEVILNATMP